MSTYVEFLKWNGRPNDVPKIFPEGGDHLIGGARINFITGFIESLNFDLEYTTYYPEANYLQFTVNNRQYSWFINSVTRKYKIVVYHLSLDVLNTYWNDIKSMTCNIERSSSLPASNVEDPAWIIPNGVEHRILKSETPIDKITMQGDSIGAPKFVFTFSGKGDQRGRGKYCTTSTATTSSYYLSEFSYNDFSDKLFGDTSILEDLQNLLFPQDPVNGIVTVRAYPFPINYRDVDGESYNKITIGVKDYTLQSYVYPVNDWGYYYLGKINLTKKFNDFRDFSPYTKSRLYIPYVGLIDISYENYFETMSIEGFCYLEYSTGDAMIILKDGNNIREVIQTTLGCSVPVSGNNYSSIKSKMITDMALNTTLALTFGAKSIPFLSSSREPHLNTTAIAPINQMDSRDTDIINFMPGSINTTYYKGYFSGVGNGMNQMWYNTRFTPPNMNYRTGDGSLVMSNISSDRYLIELWQDSVLPHEEANQRDAYGKLCLIASRLDSSSLTGFVKLRDITLPNMIGVSQIRSELFNVLTSGFYKI